MLSLEELLRSNLEEQLMFTFPHQPKQMIIEDVVEITRRTLLEWYEEQLKQRILEKSA